MLRIQVLGKGLIPRGHGIAPKKDPFPADLTLIGIILATPGLIVKYIHPDTGKPTDLTRENYQKVYKLHQHRVYKKEAAPVLDGGDNGAPKNNAPAVNVQPAAAITPVVAPTPEIAVPVMETPTLETPAVEAEKAEADAAVTEAPKEAGKEETAEEFSMKPIVAPEEPKQNKGQNNNNNNFPSNRQQGNNRNR